MRLDLAAYSDFRQPQTYYELFAAWERLARDDPYFHIRTQVASGTNVTAVTTDGGWVGLEQAAMLETGPEQLWHGLASGLLHRASGWHGVLRMGRHPSKESARVLQALRRRSAETNLLSADSAANLLRSHVTRKPRRIIQRPGVFGSVFQTKDVATEPAEERCVSIEEAVAFVEGFNTQMMEASRHCWAVAAPVTIHYQGDFAVNERVAGTSLLECAAVLVGGQP